MDRGKASTDRVTRLFMLVVACFFITTVFITYDNYFRDVGLAENEEYDMSEEFDFRKKLLPVDMEHGHVYKDEEDKVAKDLYNKVRVLCWVMTSPKNLDTKAFAVKTTWAKRCNKFVFVSSETNTSFPTIGLNIQEGREHLTGKTVQAFKYCFDNFGDSYDWFLKADDDTYVIVENLRYFLSHHDPESLVYFGHKFKVLIKQGYFSGGAGYVLSRKALEKFANVGLKNPLLCKQDGGPEDKQIGACMQKLGVKVGNSLDINGRESFHPFTVGAHLQGNFPDWFYKYSSNKAQKGLGCCSDYSVTFHYMSPADMYQIDFLLYHLRPYGLHRKDPKEGQFLPAPKKPSEDS